MMYVEIDGRKVPVSRVEKVEHHIAQPVYDIEVDGVHNYYANGVNVHNCELLWSPIVNAMNDSPWFKELYSLLDMEQDKQNTVLYKVKDTFADFRYKNLFLSPSGPNKRTLRGNTRFCSIIDELGWFPSGEDNDERERASANEVYVSLERSLKTVQQASYKLLRRGNPNIPMAYNMAISSPASIRDKMMTLIRKHENSKTFLCYHFPTWEMNPNFKREDFDDEYAADPVKAERDYGANPPKSENPWISEPFSVRRSCTSRYKVQYQYRATTSKSGKQMRYATMIGKTRPDTLTKTVLAMDAGLSNNSFGVSIHRVREIEGSEERFGSDVLAVIEVAPVKGESVINHAKLIRDLIYPLCEAYNVGLVVADRWNSVKTLQDIETDLGIPTEQYSLVPADFTMIKEMLDDDRYQYFSFPKTQKTFEEIESTNLETYPHVFKYRPEDHLYFQFLTATLDPRGCAQKGTNLTDDILRAVCLGIAFTIDEDIIDEYGLLDADEAVNEVRALGTKTANNTRSCALGIRR